MNQEEINTIKQEAETKGIFLSDEAIIWAQNDLPFLIPVIEKLLTQNDYNANS